VARAAKEAAARAAVDSEAAGVVAEAAEVEGWKKMVAEPAVWTWHLEAAGSEAAAAAAEELAEAAVEAMMKIWVRWWIPQSRR